MVHILMQIVVQAAEQKKVETVTQVKKSGTYTDCIQYMSRYAISGGLA